MQRKYLSQNAFNIFNLVIGRNYYNTVTHDNLKILSKNNANEFYNHIKEAEFKVFSQWGDDGIIQYLTSKIEISKKIFIEFGVENYTESNTRFLLINNNWTFFVELIENFSSLKYFNKNSS